MVIAIKDVSWLFREPSSLTGNPSSVEEVLVTTFGVLGMIGIIAFPIALIDQGTPVEDDLKYLGSGAIFLGVAALSTLLPDRDPRRNLYTLVRVP